MPFLRLAAIVAASLLAAAPRVALAGDGALDRFEKAHTPPDRSSDPTPASNNNNSSDNDASSSSTSSFDDTTTSSAPVTDDATGVPVVVLVACLVPPITFACLMPSHRVAAEPYAAPSLYIEPEEDPEDETSRAYRPGDLKRARIIELGLTGFRSLNEDVFSHELGMSLWLGPVLLHGRWEHLYERIETTGGFDHLDILRAQLGANILGPFVDRVELYMNAGALFLKGNDDWLPAIDVGGELRAYPVEPLALRAGSIATIFPIGPVLVDTRLEAGITMGVAEVRAGARFLYQDGAQGFWGPIATVAARF